MVFMVSASLAKPGRSVNVGGTRVRARSRSRVYGDSRGGFFGRSGRDPFSCEKAAKIASEGRHTAGELDSVTLRFISRASRFFLRDSWTTASGVLSNNHLRILLMLLHIFPYSTSVGSSIPPLPPSRSPIMPIWVPLETSNVSVMLIV